MDDFDLHALQVAGIDIIRRPTGGRAIFHANELTYSAVMPCVENSLREIYQFINEGLLEGLRLLGINAELTERGSDFRQRYTEPVSIACFSSSAKSEIHYNGKKLVGSAQRRYDSVALQHGSFLLDRQHCEIAGFFSQPLNSERENIQKQLAESTVDARSILGRAISFSEAADALKAGCAKAWDAAFVEQDEPLILEHDSSMN